jgi:two-component system chemotaxis response regulator CheB
MNPTPKIRVLIVDDSALVRRMARDTLSADPEIDVVGVAVDPYEARDKILALAPDVITLDLEMPRMDGLTFLRLLMERRPLPVVVLSSLTPRGSEFALEALRLGAVEVLGKPGGTYSFGDIGPQLVAKVKAAARARPRSAEHRQGGDAARAASPSQLADAAVRSGQSDPRALILLGASTGGVEALHEVIAHLPGNLPGIAIVQHIPALFSRNLAERLNHLGAVRVREAVDGDLVLPGTALIAPGNFHLFLHWNGARYTARVTSGPPIWHQRPSVDLLFKSVADAGGAPHCVAGVLTGMGRDGAEGLLRLRERGAATFAQDEATSVVYGMPRAAWENGAAQTVLPLERVAHFLTEPAAAAQFAAPAAVPTAP